MRGGHTSPRAGTDVWSDAVISLEMDDRLICHYFCEVNISLHSAEALLSHYPPPSFEKGTSYSYHYTSSFKLTVIAKGLPPNNTEEAVNPGADGEIVSLWRHLRNQESKFLLWGRLITQ